MTRLLVAGTDEVRLPVDGVGKRSGFIKTAIGGVGSEIYLPTSCLVDDAGNTIDSLNSQPVALGTERGLVVRNAGMVNVRGAPLAGQTLNVVAATPVTGTGLDVSSAGNVTFTVKNTVAGTAYVGNPIIVFEQSDDNVSWSPLQVVRADTGVVASTHTVAALGANASLMFDAAAEGVTFVRVRVTTAQTTNGMTITTTPGGMPFSPSVALQQVPTHGITDTQKVADNAAFVDGTTPLMPAGFIFDEVAGTALTENDIAAPRVDSKRAIVNVIEDGTTRGVRAAVKSASSAAVAADPALVVAISPNNGAKITDGTSTMAVKAASTAPVATDPAAVVAISPNSLSQALSIFTRPRQLATYAATYRLAAATGGPTGANLVHVVNTDKQFATIYHAASATKTVKIRLIRLQFSFEAAGVIEAEVQRLSATTAPVTGNPAITPGKFDTSDGAAEATCLCLPTTQGSLLAADQPVSPRFIWNALISGATAEPSRLSSDLVLYDARQTNEEKPITIRAGVAEGIAIITRDSVVGANTVTAYIEFTEE